MTRNPLTGGSVARGGGSTGLLPKDGGAIQRVDGCRDGCSLPEERGGRGRSRRMRWVIGSGGRAALVVVEDQRRSASERARAGSPTAGSRAGDATQCPPARPQAVGGAGFPAERQPAGLHACQPARRQTADRPERGRWRAREARLVGGGTGPSPPTLSPAPSRLSRPGIPEARGRLSPCPWRGQGPAAMEPSTLQRRAVRAGSSALAAAGASLDDESPGRRSWLSTTTQSLNPHQPMFAPRLAGALPALAKARAPVGTPFALPREAFKRAYRGTPRSSPSRFGEGGAGAGAGAGGGSAWTDQSTSGTAFKWVLSSAGSSLCRA